VMLLKLGGSTRIRTSVSQLKRLDSISLSYGPETWWFH
jgi:hypothetical protein